MMIGEMLLVYAIMWAILAATAFVVGASILDDLADSVVPLWAVVGRIAITVAGLVLVVAVLAGCAEETAPVRFDVAGPADCEALVSWHDTHVRRGGIVGLPWASPEFEAPARTRPELTVWNIELCDGVDIGAQVRGITTERQDVGLMATLRVEV